MTVTASKPVMSIDTLAVILSSQKSSHQGVAAIRGLIDTLASSALDAAAAARETLFALAPMAQLNCGHCISAGRLSHAANEMQSPLPEYSGCPLWNGGRCIGVGPSYRMGETVE